MASKNNAVTVNKVTPSYWRATLNNPPLNLFSAELYAGLRLLLDELETDKDVQVVVFDSSVPEYFCAHFDMAYSEMDIPGYADLGTDWPKFVQRLTHLPVVSIASIRGRTRGHGSEFVLACDMRFASLEKAILAQIEVGMGLMPGGGAMEWLPRLAGRSRALEIILGADDFDAATAEKYGYVNRALPDAELDGFVDNLARRISGFDKVALSEAKDIVNQRAPPPDPANFRQTIKYFRASVQNPGAQYRLQAAAQEGLGQDGEFERDFGRRLAMLSRI
jgi:enoyl-CoA hydratase/carnithine racemase